MSGSSSSIQAGILFPLTQMAFDNSQAGTTPTTKPTLIIAPSLNAQPLAIVPVFSNAQAQALGGNGSIFARMFQKYFALDQIGPIYMLPVPDPSGGTAASGSIITATPGMGMAVAGTLSLYIAGQLVQVGVAVGDMGPAVTTKLVAAINAMPSLPVTASVDGTTTNKTDLTAKHLGLLGNDIDVRINYQGLSSGEQLPTGMTIAITAMAGGAGTSTLTALAGIIGDQNYRFIVHPWSDHASMSVFATMMAFNGGRWSPTRKSWGHCWTARSDTAANLVTYGPTNNDPHATVFCYETGSPTPEWEAAAIFVGAAAASLRTQPNLPLQTLNLVGLAAPNASGPTGTETAWTKTVWQSLLGLGLALASYDNAGNAYILRAPTTYQDNSYGQPDQSYFDTETLYLLMAQSDYLSQMAAQMWGRTLIADNGTVFGAGIPVLTPNSMKADLVNAYTAMEELGWVEDASAFIAACTVERDTQNPSGVDILFTPFNVVGLRQVNITNQFRQFSAAVIATAQASA